MNLDFLDCIGTPFSIASRFHPCFADFPLEVSDSGLYLDKMPTFTWIFERLNQSGYGNQDVNYIHQVLQDQINKAKLDFFRAAMIYSRDTKLTGLNLKNAFKSGSYSVGQKSSKNFSSNKKYSVLHVRSNAARRGVFELKKIGLGEFRRKDANGVLRSEDVIKEVFVLDRFGKELYSFTSPVYSKTITYHQLPDSLMINMMQDGVPNDFFIAFESEGLYFNQTESWCGCGASQTRPSVLNYVKFNGLEVDNLDELPSMMPYEKARPCRMNDFGIPTMNNIFLQFSMSCDLSELVCDWAGSRNLSNPTYLQLAEAIQALSCYNIAQVMAAMDKNRFDWRSLLGERFHGMGQLAEAYRESAQSIIRYLVADSNLVDTGCFVCNTGINYTVKPRYR